MRKLNENQIEILKELFYELECGGDIRCMRERVVREFSELSDRINSVCDEMDKLEEMFVDMWMELNK